MPAVIADFVSVQFYGGRLRTAVRREHRDPFFNAALAFVDTSGLPPARRRERRAGLGHGNLAAINPAEADMIAAPAAYWHRLKLDWAVILPYEAQVEEVREDRALQHAALGHQRRPARPERPTLPHVLNRAMRDIGRRRWTSVRSGAVRRVRWLTVEGELERLTAYTYLTVPDRAAYIAIMRVFTSTLLADLSAHDLAERLDDPLPVETVAAKLDALTAWGNLIPSSRPVKAGSIREYHRVRSRYQLSALGERIQRQADEILLNADAAREVSRELLALVARGLADLEEATGRPGGIDPREALDRVSTLFAQFGQFADSVRDFYAYLGQVIFRYDLDGAEFTGFKELLLDYAETITDEVALFAPQIEASIQCLWPRLPALLAGIDAADQGLAALQDADVRVQRSRGRELGDWAGLRAWFFDDTGQGSQVDQLREATLRALQALLANAKRMIRSAGGGLSRRRDLIRLAQWFDGADDATAHDLFVAAFGLYGARHLGVVPDADQDVAATTSWWDGPAARVPISLKERGSRAPRGRTAGPEDYGDQRARLREHAEEEARRQRAAAAELRAAGPRLGDVRLSGPATRLFLDLLARSLAGAAPGFGDADVTDDDLDVRLRLIRTPGAATVVHGADGDLVLDGLRVHLGAAARPDMEAAG